MRLMIRFELRFTDPICERPVRNIRNFFGNWFSKIWFSFPWERFKWINWSFFSIGISKLHQIIIWPIFHILFIKIQGLNFRFMTISFLKFPVLLMFFTFTKFGKFMTMHSQDLLTEFGCHILNISLNSLLIKESLIVCYMIKPFKCKSCHGIFSFFNSSLSILKNFKIAFKFFII